MRSREARGERVRAPFLAAATRPRRPTRRAWRTASGGEASKGEPRRTSTVYAEATEVRWVGLPSPAYLGRVAPGGR